MMYPVLAKVRYGEISHVGRDRDMHTHGLARPGSRRASWLPWAIELSAGSAAVSGRGAGTDD